MRLQIYYNAYEKLGKLLTLKYFCVDILPSHLLLRLLLRFLNLAKRKARQSFIVEEEEYKRQSLEKNESRPSLAGQPYSRNAYKDQKRKEIEMMYMKQKPQEVKIDMQGMPQYQQLEEDNFIPQDQENKELEQIENTPSILTSQKNESQQFLLRFEETSIKEDNNAEVYKDKSAREIKREEYQQKKQVFEVEKQEDKQEDKQEEKSDPGVDIIAWAQEVEDSFEAQEQQSPKEQKESFLQDLIQKEESEEEQVIVEVQKQVIQTEQVIQGGKVISSSQKQANFESDVQVKTTKEAQGLIQQYQEEQKQQQASQIEVAQVKSSQEEKSQSQDIKREKQQQQELLASKPGSSQIVEEEKSEKNISQSEIQQETKQTSSTQQEVKTTKTTEGNSSVKKAGRKK